MNLAELVDALTKIKDKDFDTVHVAGNRLREIINREGAGSAVEPGSEDYVIRAAIVALFENEGDGNGKAG